MSPTPPPTIGTDGRRATFISLSSSNLRRLTCHRSTDMQGRRDSPTLEPERLGVEESDMGVAIDHDRSATAVAQALTEGEIEADERKEALDTVLARLRAGEREPWLRVAAGELAAQLDDWPLALECLRRLDPVSIEADDLRDRLEALGPDRRIPEPPDDLVADPGDLVARVFLQAASPSVVMARAGRHGKEWLVFVAVCLVSALLPGAWSWVIWGAAVTAHVVWLARVGIHVRDHAWCHPSQTTSGPVTDMEARVQRTSWTTQAVALATVVGPLVLGFAAGLGWFMVLAAPAALIGLLLLMSEPLHSVGWGFPFASSPRPREWCAMLFAGLVITAGGLLSAFLAWTGFGAMIPHLITAVFTWTFMNRCAGLLAHRVHLRLSADARACEPLPGPSAPPVIVDAGFDAAASAATPIARA